MKIGDEVYVHGYVDEIRGSTVIIKNKGGYFGTVEDEIVNFEIKALHKDYQEPYVIIEDTDWEEAREKIDAWVAEQTEPQTDYEKGLQQFADLLFDKDKQEQFLKECKAMGIEPQTDCSWK